ncbi:MAG: tetratricopeptide repeat protein, partial [Candidatus Zixiibacteriota bacterium]
YFGQVARDASDSVRSYQDAGNEEQKVLWTGKRNEAFDSSAVYYKRTIDAHPDDVLALEQYGTITGLREKYPEAAGAFKKLAELEPDRSEYWRAYGDFSLRLKDFDEAITAYERTVELEPDDAETWDRLAGLYKEKGMTQKEQQATQKYNELKK